MQFSHCSKLFCELRPAVSVKLIRNARQVQVGISSNRQPEQPNAQVRITKRKQPMNTSKPNNTARFYKFPAAFIAGILPVLLLLFGTQSGLAGSATWSGGHVDDPTDWIEAANWRPMTVPSDVSDTATFSSGGQTTVTVSGIGPSISNITFLPTALPFTITIFPAYGLTLNGAGIVNNSGITQNFTLPRTGGPFPYSGNVIDFTNTASAGTATSFTLDGSTTDSPEPARILFEGSSTAGQGNFIINGSSSTWQGRYGAYLEFSGSATAGDGTLTVNPALESGDYLFPGQVHFLGTSTAGNATVTFNGATLSGAYGAYVTFYESSTAGNSTLISNGGTNGGFGGSLLFYADSSGGTAQVKVFGNGNLDISGHVDSNNQPVPITIGSIEGSGQVFLKSDTLSVGSNNLNTAFSGVIQDGSVYGFPAGSFTKIGTGTLTLSGANTYAGITTVTAGTLLVTTKPSSGTGTSKVKVNAGTLGGTGVIRGRGDRRNRKRPRRIPRPWDNQHRHSYPQEDGDLQTRRDL